MERIQRHFVVCLITGVATIFFIGGTRQLIVFVPNSPNPSQGRLLRISASRVTPTDWTVDKALKSLFSLGKI